MTTLKGYFFSILTALYVLVYIIFVVIRGFLGFDLKGAIKYRQDLGRAIIRINGVQREVKGSVPEGTYLFISNHRTYMDPVMECPEAAFIPVVMNEVASWPIMGRGVRQTGVVYVKRESKSSRAATRVAMAKALDDGYSIIIYPEGGTNDLPTTKTFREGAFKIAAEKGVPVIPIAVDYKDPSFYWTNGKSFAAHVIHTFSNQMESKVAFGEPIVGNDSQELLQETQAWIDQELIRMRKEWDT